jgi:hypothetical protein
MLEFENTERQLVAADGLIDESVDSLKAAELASRAQKAAE